MNDVFSLNGKLSFVTGANRGIGAAIAKALARQGSDLLLLARDPQKLEETANEIRAMGRNVRTFSVDISDINQIIQ